MTLRCPHEDVQLVLVHQSLNYPYWFIGSFLPQFNRTLHIPYIYDLHKRQCPSFTVVQFFPVPHRSCIIIIIFLESMIPDLVVGADDAEDIADPDCESPQFPRQTCMYDVVSG